MGIFPLLFLTSVVLAQPPLNSSPSGLDPCRKENHAVILDETKRSFNWAMKEGDKAVCDDDLKPGWYRFHSAAGDIVPTGCPPPGNCGTSYPVWHRGQTPSPTEGIVNSVACAHIGDDCCKVQLPILLKNCSQYLVYFLQPTPTCHMAYCAGYMVPCPRGLVSNTGFTPCQFEVELVDVKVISHLDSEEHLQIHCISFVEKVHALDSIVVEVDWLSGGSVIHQQLYHPVDQSYAVLPDQFWKLGQTVQCRARVRHAKINLFTTQVTSKPFYAGIEFLSSSPLIVQEGGPSVNFEFRSTIPVGCHGDDCCISFKISIKYPDDTHYCPSGEPLDRVISLIFLWNPSSSEYIASILKSTVTEQRIDELGLNKCAYYICKDNWNTTHKIPLRAKSDNLYGPNQQLSLELETLTYGHKKWSHYKLPSQQIQVTGVNVSERCTSDSYIKTFDGQVYTQNLKGKFLLYKNGNHEVQVTYNNCSYRRNCNCAVTIKGDYLLVKLDICTRGYLSVWSEPIYKNHNEFNHAEEDLTVLQENEGRTYKVIFRTGTIVKIGQYLSYITVYALQTDFGKTSGLCALFDRNRLNDLVNENGSPACMYRPRAPCPQYSQRWRIATEAVQNKNKSNEIALLEDHSNYCACRKPTKSLENKKKLLEENDENEIEDKGSHADDSDQVCYASLCEYSPGIEVSEEYLRFAAEKFFADTAEAKALTVAIIPAERNPVNNPPSGWNSQTASTFCQNYIAASNPAGQCNSVAQVNVPDRVAECTSDIMSSNSSSWAAVSLNRLVDDCKIELYRNLSLWENTSAGHITAPLRLLNTLCINNCSQNGICKGGVCYCNPDFAGSDCSVQVAQAPVLVGLTSSPCDVYKSHCRFVAVTGKEFFEHPHLICLIEVFMVKDRDDSILTQGFIKTEGEFLSFQIVICPLPNLDVHSVGKHFNKDSTRALLKVSVCYKENCGTPLDLWIYDSRCWDCTASMCKPKLPGPCFYYNPYYTPHH